MSRLDVRNRTLWLAAAGSVALHALLLLWPLPEPRPPASSNRPGTLVFVEAVTPPPPPPGPPAPPEVRPPPARGPRPPPPPSPAAPPPAAGPPQRAADSPVADAPRALVQLTPALIPTGSFALSFDAGLPEQQVVRGALVAPKDLVGNLTKETLGRGRVERGLVHPYYASLGKALVKHWDVDRVAKAGGLKVYAQQLGENLKLFNETWLDRAAAYGKTGSPLDPSAGSKDSNRRAPSNDRIPGGGIGEDLEGRKELAREMVAQFRATRRATIRVVQDRTGKLTRVELVEPSFDAKVDKEALVDVTAAAEQLPVPPEEALMGRGELSSLWSFELIVSISPPVPTFTFEFDEATGFIDARLPLDRRVYKKVRLVSVE